MPVVCFILCAFCAVIVFYFWRDRGSHSAERNLPALHQKTQFRIPLAFFPVSDDPSKFFCQGAGSRVFLTGRGPVLELWKPNQSAKDALASPKPQSLTQSAQINIEFAGTGKKKHEITPLSPAPAQVNYYFGNKEEDWKTGIQGYEKVKYEEVYPGIDAIFYGSDGRLEYDFVVAPGSSPGIIRLDFLNQEAPRLDPSGDLIVETAVGPVRQYKPVAYQTYGEARRAVDAKYVLLNERQVGFTVGEYNHNAALIIDPVIGFSSYLGGTKQELAKAIAVDNQGFIYVTGDTESLNFPKVSSYQRTKGAYYDAFVAKIDPFQGKLVYCTYLGGNLGDSGLGIKADGLGNAYVAGATWSSNFPVFHALQAKNRGEQDAFLTKLDPDGRLIFSTYFGGGGFDSAIAIALDGENRPYVTGLTESSNLPVKNPVQLRLHGFAAEGDAYVSQFASDGSALLFSTFLGGSAHDDGFGIAVDPQEQIYVTGHTYSSDFPVVNAFQTQNRGWQDVFVTKINPSIPRIAYSTYIGGSGVDWVGGIAVNPAGAAVIAGHTPSIDFPTRNAIKPFRSSGGDAFVAKFSPTGQPVFSTYYGGKLGQDAYSVAYDRTGNIYFCGWTKSSDFPAVHAVQSTISESFDAFIAKLNPIGSTILFSSYLGGSEIELCSSIAVDRSFRIYVTGFTGSPDFPLRNAFQQKLAGKVYSDNDVFVTRVDPGQ
jgi:hypothetical protein